MKFVKNFFKLCFVVSLFFSHNIFVMDVDNNDFDDEMMYDDFDIFNNSDIDAFLDSNQFEVKTTDPETIIDVLVGLARLDQILQQDLFLKTAPLNRRNILDYPIYFSDKDYKFNDWVIGSHIFYNQTSRLYFGKESSCLSSYLNICGSSLLSILGQIEDEIKELLPDFDFCIERGFSLFKGATAQERRLGLLIHGTKMFKKVHFTFDFPFYWRERNYYLSCAERAEIEREFGALSPEEENDVACEYIISDQLGFGDLRFSVDYPVKINKRGFEFWAGGYTTLPISFAVKKGLKGKVYETKCCRPSIDFTELFDLAQDESTRCEACQIGFDFLTCALNNISATVLDTTLGNYRHLGLGGYYWARIPLDCCIKRPWAHKVSIKNKMMLEYLLPWTDRRSFVDFVCPEEFTSRDFEDPDQAVENLKFLEQKFVDKFFPFVYKARVHPGIVFLWLAKLAYESKRFGFDLGFDFWARSGEKLKNICVPSQQRNKLNICKATRWAAYQASGFGSIFYKVVRPEKEIIISLAGGGVFANRGIGKDFSIALNIEGNF